MSYKRIKKRAEAREKEKYLKEWGFIENWFLTMLFHSPRPYEVLYRYCHYHWQKYCQIAERNFKVIQPDPFLFHQNYKPIERI